MKRATHAFLAGSAAFLSMSLAAAPSVYPTGTTIYDPSRTWNGYTVLSLLSTQAVVVIDMNGNEVKRWENYNNGPGGPARVLPGGSVISSNGARPPHQEAIELVQQDFDGDVIWRFDRNEQIETGEGETIWALRQHHDWQREDLPAGYYSPDARPALTGASTLILTHTNHVVPNVAEVVLEDDRIIEVSADGEITWEWTIGEHIDEFDFSAEARATIRSAPGFSPPRGSLDWFHINSATYVGPNRWYDAGDERFAPENVIISGRQVSIVAIVARDGSIVWQLGPDFDRSDELRAIRQIIGQHHAHLIPPGLPGAGNVMIFDNGGSSGYGTPSPIAPNGSGIYARATSRVIEIDPVTLELVWSYQAGSQFFPLAQKYRVQITVRLGFAR
jgi:outer membrane protein assembly factor BamB